MVCKVELQASTLNIPCGLSHDLDHPCVRLVPHIAPNNNNINTTQCLWVQRGAISNGLGYIFGSVTQIVTLQDRRESAAVGCQTRQHPPLCRYLELLLSNCIVWWTELLVWRCIARNFILSNISFESWSASCCVIHLRSFNDILKERKIKGKFKATWM